MGADCQKHTQRAWPRPDSVQTREDYSEQGYGAQPGAITHKAHRMVRSAEMSDRGTSVTLIFYKVGNEWWKEPALNLIAAAAQFSSYTRGTRDREAPGAGGQMWRASSTMLRAS